MRTMNGNSQRGLTVTGLLFGGMILVLVAVLGMKVVPDVIEYWKIKSDIEAMAQDPALKQATPSEIRSSFGRRADVDQISAIKASDLDISRNGNTLVLGFAYRKEIRLFGAVSLVIDFEATTDK
jgi:hypothetical protein